MNDQFNCPNCGSADTATFELVYLSGRSAGSIAGAGIDGGGDVVAMGGVINSSSQLAMTAAPPAKAESFWGRVGAICGIAMLVICPLFLLDHENRKEPLPILFVMLVAAVATYFGAKACRKASKYNRDVLPAKVDSWRKNWMCKRCGTAFVPGRAAGAAMKT